VEEEWNTPAPYYASVREQLAFRKIWARHKNSVSEDIELIFILTKILS
jgi:hypothetical protein